MPEPAPTDRAVIAARLLTIAEAAALCGVSTKTLKRAAGAGELPGVVRPFGQRLVRIDREALERWIADGCPRRRVRVVR